MQTFKLVPYPANGLPKIGIVGEIERIGNQLSIRYKVRGNVESILFPASSGSVRKDGLWETTCFEFFLAIPNCPDYWEFNISPSGEWNIYHMDAYRQVNMREETRIRQLPFEFQKESGYSLGISVDLNPIIQPEQCIQVGITAVIQTKGRSKTYWALTHHGPYEDFHIRESFIFEI